MMKRHKPKESNIWHHFKETQEDGKATCNICKKVLSYKTTITNLKKHRKVLYPTVPLREEEPVPKEKNAGSSSGSGGGCEASAGIINIDEEEDADEPLEQESRPSTSGIPSRCPEKPSGSTSTASNAEASVSTPAAPKSPHTVQPSIKKFIPGKFGLLDKKVLDRKIMNVLIKDYRPSSTFHCSGMKELINYMAPDYVIPIAKHFPVTLLDAIYNECIDNIIKKLENIDSLSIATDHWTSKYGKKTNFIGVTAHYIDSDFVFQHNALEVIQFRGRHDSENIARALKDILINNWHIFHKILIFTTDNAANIVRATKICLEKKHLECFGHKINISVVNSFPLKDLESLPAREEGQEENEDDGIEEATDNDDDFIFEEDELENAPESGPNIVLVAFQKMKTIVNYSKRSPQFVEKLFDNQKILGIRNPLVLIQSVKTRWNSIYYMTKRFLHLKQPIQITLATTTAVKLEALTDDEWLVLEEVCELLEPLEEVTTELSSQNYVSASKIIPVTNGLVSVLQDKIAKNRASHVRMFAEKLLQQLKVQFVS
nr:PREDICTED: zinc finger BED domain-containing protein 6 [Bemisia tabaci]